MKFAFFLLFLAFVDFASSQNGKNGGRPPRRRPPPELIEQRRQRIQQMRQQRNGNANQYGDDNTENNGNDGNEENGRFQEKHGRFDGRGGPGGGGGGGGHGKNPRLGRLERLEYHNSVVNWAFLHYHKTGHDLAELLSEPFYGKQCNTSTRFHYPRREDISPYISQMRKVDISLLSANELRFPWKESFSILDSNFRILHFVRDPFDMVVSGYLYHAQTPPPPPERWLVDRTFSPCKTHNDDFLVGYLEKLGAFTGNRTYVNSLLTKTKKLCTALETKYRSKSVDYNVMLNVAKEVDVMEAIKIEAVRAILSKDGGDALRMAVNSLWESESAHGISMRVFMSDFPIGDKPKFTNTTTNIFKFLMAPVDSDKDTPPFYECVPLKEAVSRAVEAAFVEKAVDNSTSSSAVHVTSGFISKEEREQIITKLKADEVLGPLLTIIQRAINSKVQP